MGEEDRNGSNLYLDNIDIWALVYHTKKNLSSLPFSKIYLRSWKTNETIDAKPFLSSFQIIELVVIYTIDLVTTSSADNKYIYKFTYHLAIALYSRY